MIDFKAFRKIKKMTQQDAADYFGVTQSFISQIEKGNCPIPERILLMIKQEYKEEEVVSDEVNISDNTLKVPLLPLDAKAGSLNDFVMSVKLQDCERIISPIRNVDFAITVKGDSMAPKIPSKSKVFIKKIDHSRFVEWGEIYVLDTCNGTVIKRIMPTDDAQVIRCVSLNADYPSFDVALVDVYGIYQVLLVMTEL